MTLEGFDGRDVVLLSYDVPESRRSTAVRVCQIVFGRGRPAETPAPSNRKEGFIWRPGVVWVGQSVLMLPRADAEELADRLRALGVRVTSASISLSRSAAEGFRRVRSPPGR